MEQNNSVVHQAEAFTPAVASFSGLCYGPHSKKLSFRVLREWNSCSLHNYYEISTNYVILDSQNQRYWTVTNITNHKNIKPALCAGLLYYISNFKIVPVAASVKPIDTDVIIVIGKHTKVQEQIQSSSIPRYNFAICSMQTIFSRLYNNEILSDVAGVITKVTNINYETNDIERVNITLVTNSLLEIEVSLWGVKAALFGIHFRYNRNRNVVMVATSLMVKKRRERIYLSSTQSTCLNFNPRFEMITDLAHHIARNYGEFICPVPEETHGKICIIPSEVPSYSTLKKLLVADFWDHEKYSCNVTIIDVLCNHLARTSCIRCKQQIVMHGNMYYCIHCARKFMTPIKSTGVSILVRDKTCTATVIIRGRELKQLTGFQVADFVRYYKDVGTTPKCFIRLKGSRCTFELQLKASIDLGIKNDILVTKVNEYINKRGRRHHVITQNQPARG